MAAWRFFSAKLFSIPLTPTNALAGGHILQPQTKGFICFFMTIDQSKVHRSRLVPSDE